MRYLTLLILLAGCAQNNSASSSGSAQALAATQNKVLFSSWYSTSTQNTLDLTNAKLPDDAGHPGVGQMNVTLADGSQCVTLIQLSGDGISGSFTIWNSTSVMINGSSTLLNTAACEALNSVGTYAISGASLNLCTGSSCEVLQ